MTPQHVISQLLTSESKNHKNIELLKKIVLTAYLGRLQINGQSPANSIAFANYLFDHENVLFDFTRVSDVKKEEFKKWLLSAHHQEKEKAYFTKSSVNEYRGFTAEVRIGWWGRLVRWLLGDYTAKWKINGIDLSLNYQLLGIEMNEGQQGILVGFQHLLVPSSNKKYKAEDDPEQEPLGNTKRVLITDNLVDQLMKWNLKSVNFKTICDSAHPLAIDITNVPTYYKDMQDYRLLQQYIPEESWYKRIWSWCTAWFAPWFEVEPEKKLKHQGNNNKLTLLHEDENGTIAIYQRQNNQIVVAEKRPNIENLVYCGGGAKIFAHVGVWKALNEAGIAPKKFAGSSAGAMMALMCYLGLSAEKIAEFFKHFRQENLVYFDINRRGFSEPGALKTAFDYVIALKVKEITTKYKIPFPAGKITFATLEDLRLRFPDCGLEQELIVTATNKRLRKTSYFSFRKTPHMEVSEAVKISASLPVVFRDTRLDGDDYNDGGVLNNFPTDAFHADDTTFLESEYGNNMKTLAVQFDNGIERAIVDSGGRVYRENFILNWLYGLLSGVSDPVSGWEQDRLKLRKYSAQSIIVEVGNTSASSFSVKEKDQQRLINSGYSQAKSYLDARYEHENDAFVNQELMYSTFASLEELLAYSCYKGKKNWFNVTLELIRSSSLGNKQILLKQAEQLQILYFPSLPKNKNKAPSSSPTTFFGNEIISQQLEESKDHLVFLALYPIFIKLSLNLLKNVKEQDILHRARHSFTTTTLFAHLRHFNVIKYDTHIVFHIFHNLVKALEQERRSHFSNVKKCERIYQDLELLEKIIYKHDELIKPEYYGCWNLDLRQGRRVLKTLNSKSTYITKLCDDYLKYSREPTQTLSEPGLQDEEEHVEVPKGMVP